jgi:hypothetical protein
MTSSLLLLITGTWISAVVITRTVAGLPDAKCYLRDDYEQVTITIVAAVTKLHVSR